MPEVHLNDQAGAATHAQTRALERSTQRWSSLAHLLISGWPLPERNHGMTAVAGPGTVLWIPEGEWGEWGSVLLLACTALPAPPHRLRHSGAESALEG